MAPQITFSILASALFIAVASAGVDFSTIPFTYSGSHGPANWGSLNPAYATCSSGKMQSPININKNEAVRSENWKPLTRDYKPANATLINNGFKIGVHYESNGGVLIIDGKNYTLKEIHFHSPSEHQIDGVQYDAEFHLVHLADDGSVSVGAILFQYGDSDPFVAKLEDKLIELAKEACAENEAAHIPLGILDNKLLRKNTRKYYRYVGSLTVPPCSENVIWSILGKVRTISKEQVEAMKAPLGDPFKKNSRPVQPVNGRKVELYSELN